MDKTQQNTDTDQLRAKALASLRNGRPETQPIKIPEERRRNRTFHQQTKQPHVPEHRT